MRRRLAAGSIAVLVALAAAACGDGESDDTAQPPADNTAQVCADAEAAQAEQIQGFQEEMTALAEEDLPEEEFEQAALERMETAVTGWSDGLAAQAEVADDPELAAALADLSDGLADAADELTVESVRTGEIPGQQRLDEIGQTLTDMCYPEGVPTT